MLVTDPNQADNPIVFANPAFLALTGYLQEELLGRNCRLLQGPQTDRATIALMREALRQRREINIEIINYRRDGSTFWNALYVCPVFGPAGELLYFFSSQMDVSRRRAAEQSLAPPQPKGLGALAGGMAHEFNNLLTVIRGNLEPLIRDTGDPRAAIRLSRVRDAAERATLLTRAIVAFARCQYLEDRTLDVCAELLRMESELARLLSPGASLSLGVPSAPLSIRADPKQFRAVLIHILRNARLAGSGAVRIAVQSRASGGVRPADVEVSIIDDGCGMAEDVAARATEPFFTTRPVGSGVGLGLSMADGYMRQSGGRLELISRQAEGTTIRLVFPGRPHLPFQAPRARPGEMVLMVEADADLRAVFVAALQDLGYGVTACASIGEARQHVAPMTRVDLVLSDVMPPGPDWADLPRPIPALLFSSAEPGQEESGMVRPFTLADLAGQVRARLDGRSRSADR